MRQIAGYCRQPAPFLPYPCPFRRRPCPCHLCHCPCLHPCLCHRRKHLGKGSPGIARRHRTASHRSAVGGAIAHSGAAHLTSTGQTMHGLALVLGRRRAMGLRWAIAQTVVRGLATGAWMRRHTQPPLGWKPASPPLGMGGCRLGINYGCEGIALGETLNCLPYFTFKAVLPPPGV